MKHQQIHPRARSIAPSPQAVALRKGTIRSRPRTRWTTDMDDIELAHASLGYASRGVVGRDGSNDIRSVANVQKLSMLQEIFPSVPVEVMEDVLIAAQFFMDTAASMLSEISRELDAEPTAEDEELVDWASVQTEDADQWHEVSESRPELQQWVIVQDDWEVIDGHAATSQENVRSYADVLRASAGGAADSTGALPELSLSRPAVSTSPLITLKEKDAAEMPEDLDLGSSKSFGTRKRRFLRKFRA